jgi:hypothetical protein
MELEQLGLRACQCGFCRAHNARATSDPRGTIRFRVREPGLLSRYRMGHGITDFLVCARCGVFMAAMMEDGGTALMTVNANTFIPCPPADFPVKPMDYGAENTDQRISRRRLRWTPVADFNLG